MVDLTFTAQHDAPTTMLHCRCLVLVLPDLLAFLHHAFWDKNILLAFYAPIKPSFVQQLCKQLPPYELWISPAPSELPMTLLAAPLTNPIFIRSMTFGGWSCSCALSFPLI